MFWNKEILERLRLYSTSEYLDATRQVSYFELFKGQESNHIDLIEEVNMMTPEGIHLNSFMYEPVIDMSAEHLVKLYNRCKNELV